MLRMRVDGKDLMLDSMRWSAYEATRRSAPLAVDAHMLTVTSQLRMAFNDSALLWKINIQNQIPEGVPPDAISYQDIIHTLEFSVQAIARQVRKHSRARTREGRTDDHHKSMEPSSPTHPTADAPLPPQCTMSPV